MSADVELQNISVTFGNFYAAKNVNVKINEGEFFSFLGPSGCGKTTILRAISGFLDPSEGKVLIGGKDMGGIGPNKRPTSLIFQNLALFPLMSVAENIAFSLEVRGVDKIERRKRGKRRSVGNLRANQKVQKKDIIMKPKMMTLHQGLPMLMIS